MAKTTLDGNSNNNEHGAMGVAAGWAAGRASGL